MIPSAVAASRRRTDGPAEASWRRQHDDPPASPSVVAKSSGHEGLTAGVNRRSESTARGSLRTRPPIRLRPVVMTRAPLGSLHLQLRVDGPRQVHSLDSNRLSSPADSRRSDDRASPAGASHRPTCFSWPISDTSESGEKVTFRYASRTAHESSGCILSSWMRRACMQIALVIGWLTLRVAAEASLNIFFLRTYSRHASA